MSSPGDLTFAPLTRNGESALRAFRCGRILEPWSVAVEAEIHTTLPRELSDGRTEGLGLWADTMLVGVVAWRTGDYLAVRHVLYLAVSLEQRNQGVGRLLKERVLDDARAAGLRAVRSEVHEQNLRMLRLNQDLGAQIEPADEDRYCACTILLSEPPASTSDRSGARSRPDE